jgi:hypothetical protein
MRSLGLAVVAAALLATGCGYRERMVSAADRRMCDRQAAAVAAAGSPEYKDFVDACIQNLKHPERGGG